ncbi:Ubiquitin-conjugating enzyme E2 C [Plecturocebus cupreus]
MTLMMSGDKGISAFPESDNLFKWNLLGEPDIDSPLNYPCCRALEKPHSFKKYLQETYSEQVTSQEP